MSVIKKLDQFEEKINRITINEDKLNENVEAIVVKKIKENTDNFKVSVKM